MLILFFPAKTGRYGYGTKTGFNAPDDIFREKPICALWE